MILAGEIGADECLLATFADQGDLKPLAKQKFVYDSEKKYSCLEEVVRDFLGQTKLEEPIYGACFGIAGPVIEGCCKMPNRGWEITVENLQELLGCLAVDLLNDMPAMGKAIPTFSEKELIDLNPKASPKSGNRALMLATGKGLGELLLYYYCDEHLPSLSEGGHANFAPSNALEDEFLSYFRKNLKHVSGERVLSWAGLVKIYEFLRDTRRGKESTALKKRLSQEQLHHVITELALANAKKDDLCTQTLDLFVSIYGAMAGDIALRNFAVNGVYISGSIALDIKDKLLNEGKPFEGIFMKAFRDKEGQFAEQNANTPVKLILNQEAVLRGAAQHARELVGS
jgi:glucokinase